MGVAVTPHHHCARITPADEAVVLATVDLQLVLIERMPEVTRYQAVRQRLAIYRLQGERRIGQAGDIGFLDQVLAMVHDLFARDHATPDRRQRFQQRTVTIALLILARLQRGEWLFQPRKIGKQIVEAAILSIDHYDMLDMLAKLGIQVAILTSLRRWSGTRQYIATTCCHGRTGQRHATE